ncbi:hypothetical protein ACP70R_023442 [Stipagrostis hirtigluma subsp. patula]
MQAIMARGSPSEPAGIGSSAPTAQDAEYFNLELCGDEPPLHHFFEKDTPSPAQAVSNGAYTNGNTCVRTAKSLPWTKEGDLILLTAENAEFIDKYLCSERVPLSLIFFEEYRPSPAQAVSNGSSSQSINVDDDTNGSDCVRTEKRLPWTKEEDLILKAVAAAYNNNIPKERARKPKQVKDHFGRIKKGIASYCASWKEANNLRANGESGVDFMVGALKTYEDEHKNDGPYMFKHCWEVLRKERKWDAYLKCLRDEPQIGGKQAKKQQKRERKEQASIIDLEDELDAQNTGNEGHKEMLQTRRHVSSENHEARKLARDKETLETQMNATKEQKELVMLQIYHSLMIKDTSGMSKDERSERLLALKCLSKKLFGKPE